MLYLKAAGLQMSDDIIERQVFFICRGVAQLVERRFWEAEVVSSSLATPTDKKYKYRAEVVTITLVIG